MASPIRQARRQAEFLRAFLQRHRERLLGREQVGLRTLARVVRGTDQRGFANVPIQLMIAVSDNGRIRRLNGWKEPEKPFRVFVSKADLRAKSERSSNVTARVRICWASRREGTACGAWRRRKPPEWPSFLQRVMLNARAMWHRGRRGPMRTAAGGCVETSPPTALRTQNLRASIAARGTSPRDGANSATTGGAVRAEETRRCPWCVPRAAPRGAGAKGLGFARRGRRTSASARSAERQRRFGRRRDR